MNINIQERYFNIKRYIQKNRKNFIGFATIILIGVIFTFQFISTNRVQANSIRVEELKERSKVESQEQLADELIRFHVIANSDSKKDQAIKLKVRNAVLEEIVPYLEKSQSLEETREIIENKTEDLIEVAQEVLRKNGVDYGVKASLGQHEFPTKYYGDFSLPAGKYEAFRIVLGNGSGANWWCVMFPPLCFVHTDEEDSEPKEDSLIAEKEQEEKTQEAKQQEEVEVKEKEQGAKEKEQGAKEKEQEEKETNKVEELIEPASKREENPTQETENTVEESKEKQIEKVQLIEEEPIEEKQPVQIRWKFLETLQNIFQ